MWVQRLLWYLAHKNAQEYVIQAEKAPLRGAFFIWWKPWSKLRWGLDPHLAETSDKLLSAPTGATDYFLLSILQLEYGSYTPAIHQIKNPTRLHRVIYLVETRGL